MFVRCRGMIGVRQKSHAKQLVKYILFLLLNGDICLWERVRERASEREQTNEQEFLQKPKRYFRLQNVTHAEIG